MHIPTIYGIAENFRKYPIIIARTEGNDILGMTTLKNERPLYEGGKEAAA